MQSLLRRAWVIIAACGVAHTAWAAAADDASVRASAGILMSRGMDTKDRVAAADSLARYFPRAAVPVLIEALNETSEPVRRAAARGLWTIARAEARRRGRRACRGTGAAARLRRQHFRGDVRSGG
jgi:hypothetical protein